MSHQVNHGRMGRFQDKAIYGLGPIEITVSYFEDFKQLLKNVYGMRTIMNEEDVALLEVGEGGNGGQVILRRIQRTSCRIRIWRSSSCII